MKKIIFNIVLFVPLCLLGQEVNLSADFKVTASTPFQVVDAPDKEYIEVGNDHTISVKSRGERVIIQLFNVLLMKEVQRNEYEDFPKYTHVQSILKAGGRLFYVFEAINKEEKTFTVYYREIDIEKGSFKEIKTLFTTKGIVTLVPNRQPVTMFGGPVIPKFDVTTSFDGSKILIQYRYKPEVRDDSKNYDELGFYVFDNTFNKIWNKEVKMPHTEEEMNNLAYAINKDGVVYMLSRINADESFELITVSQSEGLKNKRLPVKKGLFFDRFDLRESANGNIIAAGYYANGVETKVYWTNINSNLSSSKSVNVNGIYVFEISKEGSIVRDNDYPFSIELIKKYLSKRQKGKAEKREDEGLAGINDLVMRNFVLNSDGSIVIIGEVYYKRNGGSPNRPLTPTNKALQGNRHMQEPDTYYWGNIVATKIDANGKLLWSEKMPKNQRVKESSMQIMFGMGISYIQGKGAHYILFVDNRKNAILNIDDDTEPNIGGFGGYLTAYKIDDVTGKIDKHLILDLTDIGGQKAYQFSLNRIFEAKDKTFMLETYIKDKLDMMVKMELVK